jgi:hypothetical protein
MTDKEHDNGVYLTVIDHDHDDYFTDIDHDNVVYEAKNMILMIICQPLIMIILIT